MQYELAIQDLSGVWRPLDIFSEVPAMTYQINTLANLSDRQATRSATIKLPKSPRNVRTFDFADMFNIRSRYPYDLRPVRLSYDGVPLIGRNFVLYVDRVTNDAFECQIVSDALDIFDQMADASLSELGLDPIEWTVDDMLASNRGERDHRYFITTSVVGARSANIGTAGEVQQRFVMPHVSLRWLAEKVINYYGFTLDTDLTDLPGYAEDWMPLNSDARENDPSQFANANGSIAAARTFTPNSDTVPFYMWYNVTPTITNGYGAIKRDTQEIGGGTHVGVRFTASVDCTIEVNTRFEWVSGNYVYEAVTNISKVTRGGVVENVFLNDSDIGQNNLNFTNINVELKAGESIFVFQALLAIVVIGNIPGSTYNVGMSFNFLAEFNEQVPPGGNLDIATNLQFKSQRDVIQAFAELYGLTINVRRDDMVFEAYNMQRVVNRVGAGDFVDWSEKLDYTEEKNITFALENYAQENIIGFEDNSDDDYSDQVVITVDDKKLNPRENLIIWPFEAGKNLFLYVNSANGMNVASYPMYEREADENSGIIGYNYKGLSKNHIVRETTDLRNILVYPNVNAETRYYVPLYAAIHERAQTYVNTYYDVLVSRLLQYPRRVEASFLLQPLDIIELDLSRPVYVEYFGSFFYLAKINNFVANALTRVEIIRL